MWQSSQMRTLLKQHWILAYLLNMEMKESITNSVIPQNNVPYSLSILVNTISTWSQLLETAIVRYWVTVGLELSLLCYCCNGGLANSCCNTGAYYISLNKARYTKGLPKLLSSSRNKAQLILLLLMQLVHCAWLTAIIMMALSSRPNPTNGKQLTRNTTSHIIIDTIIVIIII